MVPSADQQVQDSTAALLHKVAEVGSALCHYAPGHGDPEKWPSSTCDCKYGASGAGEQNGCAEMRSVHRMLIGRSLPAHDTCPVCGGQRVRVDGFPFAAPSMFCPCRMTPKAEEA